jgi:pimeloyl-ACP methyl ester carboxylesterase
MESIYIDHPKGKVHALRFGNGPRLLIALHGFGDRARMFAVLAEALSTEYTTIAIDLPFHGQTEWRDKTFTKTDLLEIVSATLVADTDAEQGSVSVSASATKVADTRFTLMGFSFGARFAQAMLPELQTRLDKLILLSPDGINTRGMGMAVHTPMWMRRVLYRTLQKPDWFLNLLAAGRKMGVVPPLIQHFLAANLSRPDRFQRTFGCWFALNDFYLRRREIRAIWEKGAFPIDIYYGAKDEMIRLESVEKLVSGLRHVRLHKMEEDGHRVVGEGLGKRMEILGGQDKP